MSGTAEAADIDDDAAISDDGAAAGPWDDAEAPDDDVQRLDLGSVRVPTPAGIEVRMEADPKGVVTSVLLVSGDAAVQVGAFAAPRSDGIWDEVRTEIAAGLARDGGTSTEVTGAYGTELHAEVTGPQGRQAVRFVGVDGPRWFLRAVFHGRAAVDPDAVPVLDQVVRGVVVVRGGDPMPVRDPLPLRLPKELADRRAAASVAAGGSVGETAPVDPRVAEGARMAARARATVRRPRRGPEITEIR